jgi:hypothetical protein
LAGNHAEHLAPVWIQNVEKKVKSSFRQAQRGTFFDEKSKRLATDSEAYKAEVEKYSTELAQALVRLREKCKPVFLGRAHTRQAEAARLCLAKELEAHYLRVTPSALNLLDEEESIIESLSNCSAAVHFLGDAESPNGAANDLRRTAAEHSVKLCPGPTILYQAYNVILSGEEKAWFQTLRPHLTPLCHYLSRSTDQEVVSLLKGNLRGSDPQPAASATGAELGLVCGEDDVPLARELKQRIEERVRLEVQYPDFLVSSKAALVRNLSAMVRTSGSLLFCWGRSDEAQLQSYWEMAEQQRDRRKRAWYLVPPDIKTKKKKRPGAICQSGKFKYSLLADFLPQLKQRPRMTR